MLVVTPNAADAIPVCGKFINFTSTENTLDYKGECQGGGQQQS